MNVSLPFASPARKQDTTNNNKQGQPHDTHTMGQISLGVVRKLRLQEEGGR